VPATFASTIGPALRRRPASRRATATGRRLTVVNARGIVRRVLDITGTFPTLAGEDPFEPERA